MTTSAPTERLLQGHAATLSLGRALGVSARALGYGVLALTGHLGAGKTTLVKGLAEGLGVASAAEVTSPTFLRVVRWAGSPSLVHLDAYRMSGAGDIVELGLDEDFAAASGGPGDDPGAGVVVAVEWPDVVADALPSDRLDVTLEHVDEGRRRVRLTPGGEASRVWLGHALAAWSDA